MFQFNFIKIAMLSCAVPLLSFASVECENPLHQKIHDTIPTFVKGYSDSETMKMFRGVQAPQFTQEKLLHFLFHDPYIYSSGLMIEASKGASLTTGSWTYTPPTKSGSVDNLKAFSERWDEMLKDTASNVVAKDGEHPVWDQKSYSSYNGGDIYNWVQFASTLLETASGYVGTAILNMDIPVARVNPQNRASDLAYVIPVLIAPWEVRSASINDNTKVTLKKVFSDDFGAENRCIVSYLEVKNSTDNTVGYLSLCDDQDTCNSDPALIDKIFAIGMALEIKKFKMEGEQIQVTTEKPEGRGGICSDKNLFTTVQDLSKALEPLTLDSQYSRLKKQLGVINRLDAIKCISRIKKNIELWKQVPQLPWKHRLIIGLGMQDGASVSDAIDQCIGTENAIVTCESKIEKFAVMDTTLTRKEFIQDLLRVIGLAPAKEQSKKAIEFLKAYLVKI